MARSSLYFGIAARRFQKRFFGEQTSFLRAIVRVSRRRGLKAFIFEPADVRLDEARVLGWTPTKNGWKKRWYPIPHVIYDRLWGLGPNKTRHCREVLRRLQDERGAPVFNPDFGDKLAVYNVLSRSSALSPHLPWTLPFSEENLKTLLLQRPVVFVKPVRGRQGKGIVRCIRTPSGWRLDRRVDERSIRSSASSVRDVAEQLAQSDRTDGFLIQEGLSLVRVGQSAVDVRVIAQRDLKGAWRVSGIGVRLGQRGGFLSNLHAGGRACTLSKLLKRLRLKRSRARIQQDISELALEAVKTLSKEHPLLGEVGLDLGIDKSGRLWILEMNRQPGRATFARAGLHQAWRKTRLRVVHYAEFLARSKRADPVPHRERAPIPPPNA